VVVPQLIANLGIVGINFLWHDGCDPEHPVNHSRNFTGSLLNFLSLNNGYHGMHHEEPGMHWSLLPEAHARRIHPGLHPALEAALAPEPRLAHVRGPWAARDLRREAGKPYERLTQIWKSEFIHRR
jgi:fatty acid desaturase